MLKEESYIDDFLFISQDKKKSMIRLFLKYDYQGRPVIENIKRISKPNRVYVQLGKTPRVLDGLEYQFYLHQRVLYLIKKLGSLVLVVKFYVVY